MYAPQAKRALELGCGTGFALRALRQALPKAQIAGSELHSLGLVTARKRHGDDVELIQMDARHCHITDALDLVCAFDVLEHIPEDDLVLAEIGRVLKPGGMLIATVPQHPWMWSTADDVALHQRRYRRGELARKAAGAGLRLDLPVELHDAFVSAFGGGPPARTPAHAEAITQAEVSETQLNVSPAGNAILLGLARAEHRLRRAGVPLPFGGSQVLVAQRP